MRHRGIVLLFFTILVKGGPSLWAEDTVIQQMDFQDQNIRDILVVLGRVSGRSIVPDETVTGKGSFHFTATDFKTALESFLSAYKLYYKEEGGIIYVSRVFVSCDPDAGTVSLHAENVPPQLVLQSLSREVGVTVVFDALPRDAVTVHADGVTPFRAVQLVMWKFPEYRVTQRGGDLIEVRQLEEGAREERDLSAGIVKEGDGTYSVNLRQARFSDVIEKLMGEESKEYVLFLSADPVIETLVLSHKPFQQLLDIVLEQVGVDVTERDEVYYFFEIQRQNVLKDLKDTRVVHLSHIPVTEAVSLIPGELANNSLFRVDKSTNSLILLGSKKELDPVERFLRQIDIPLEGKQYYRYRMRYVPAKEVVSLIPPRLLGIPPITASGDEYTFYVLLDDRMKQEFDEFVKLVDRETEAVPFTLKFIRKEDFLSNLPTLFSKEEIKDSGYPSLLFYVGPEGKREAFFQALELIDRPQPQIRYDILVVQYQKSEGSDWSRNLDVSLTDTSVEQEPFSLVGSMGNLVSLGIDVVSEFGYTFASQLNLKLEESRANIYAHTTLTALSGKDVSFQNTSTFRYRDLEVDPDTGELLSTGVIRELTSGFILNLGGWVSGDGMITMNISATLSERSSESSDSTSAIPPTTERVVSTFLRTDSGKPVSISGLVQKKKTKIVNKVPVLGDIPLLGFLFRNSQEKEEDMEMVIYVVPRVMDSFLLTEAPGLVMEQWYHEFMER